MDALTHSCFEFALGDTATHVSCYSQREDEDGAVTAVTAQAEAAKGRRVGACRVKVLFFLQPLTGPADHLVMCINCFTYRGHVHPAGRGASTWRNAQIANEVAQVFKVRDTDQCLYVHVDLPTSLKDETEAWKKVMNLTYSFRAMSASLFNGAATQKGIHLMPALV